MPTSLSMLDIITARAKQTYEGELEYNERWIDHWFSVANEYKTILLKEGLEKTAAEIDAIIAEQKHIVGRT